MSYIICDTQKSTLNILNIDIFFRNKMDKLDNVNPKTYDVSAGKINYN